LGLVVPDVSNPFFAEVARGAELEASTQDYNVFLCNTNEDPQRELAVLASLEEKRVDGVLLCSSRLPEEDLAVALSHYVAAVLFNRKLHGSNVGAVLIADEHGGALATAHLLRGGHQKIAFLSGPPPSWSGQQRVKGYRAAMAAAGYPDTSAWVRVCSPTVAGGREMTLELLQAHPELTALFCYNDLVAIGALQACAQLGRTVPNDLAIVGFDDIPLAALVTPALTTCSVPRYDLGRQAMQLLLERIDGCTDQCRELIVEPELIVRASA
jgi:LacI family transcriptional regulator